MDLLTTIEFAQDDLYNGKKVGDMTDQEREDMIGRCRAIGFTDIRFVERHKPFYIAPEEKVRLIVGIQEIAARLTEAGKSPALVSRRELLQELALPSCVIDTMASQLEKEGRIRIGRLVNDNYYELTNGPAL